jgi:hypothetical protein
MKLLFENWRKYLKETSDFGDVFEQWLHGEKEGCEPEARSPACLKKYGFKLLGRGGSWRDAYSLPDNDDIVLKMVNQQDFETSKAKEMNRVEANSILNTGFPDLLPKFYESADDYNWILVERVFTVPENWMEIYFPELNSLASKLGVIYNNHPSELFIELLEDTRAAVKNSGNYKDFDLDLGSHFDEEQKQKIKKEIIKAMNPLFKRMLQFSLETDAATWDIRDTNIGVSGDGRFMMLDPGIGIEESSEVTALSTWAAPKRKKEMS